MVELTCSECNQTEEFPDMLTVVSDLKSASWKLVEMNEEKSDSVLIFEKVLCPSCSSENRD